MSDVIFVLPRWPPALMLLPAFGSLRGVTGRISDQQQEAAACSATGVRAVSYACSVMKEDLIS